VFSFCVFLWFVINVMITLRNWNTAFSQNFYCCVDCIGSSFRSVFRTPFMVTHTIPLCLQILRRSYFASEALHVALYMFLLLLAVGEGGDRFLSHNELRPSVSPVLNPYPHNGVRVCVCVCRHEAEVSAYARMCICVCCEQSLSSLF